MDTKQELLVSRTTDFRKLAWSIQKYHEEGADIDLAAIGKESEHVAIKAVIEANKNLSPSGKRILLCPLYGDTVPARDDVPEMVKVVFRLYEDDV